MLKLKLEAKVVVLVGQDFIEFAALLVRDTNEVRVVQGGKVVTTIIVVVFHDLLPFPHHCLDTRLLVCLSLCFLSFACTLFVSPPLSTLDV
jgi:hypothetical protein